MQVVFYSRFEKDIRSLSDDDFESVLAECEALASNPFPYGKKRKRIQQFREFALFRLRLDLKSGSYRVFYGIKGETIYVLRLAPKPDAEWTIKQLRKLGFPPAVISKLR